jgi:hypothetical protein
MASRSGEGWVMRLLAFTTIGGALLWGAFSAFATPQPRTDLPGVTSNSDFHNGAPLQPADVQFYLRIQRATLDRYQHPTAQDAADIAENKRLRQAMMDAQVKVAADAQAGKSYQAMQADMFTPTPAQQAVMDRAEALLSGHVADLLAANAGMPENQWDSLSTAVETAAGLHDGDRFGSGDDSPTTLTPEQRERAAKIIQRRADNRKLVAPDAPEIKKLAGETAQLIAARAQAP